MKHEDHRNATAWWGTCDDLPDMDDWENGGGFSDCYVCDGTVQWGGADRVKDVLQR